MSKSAVVNKSEEIRNILKANPKIAVKDVVEMLAERKIDVGANLVYLIRGKMPTRRLSPARGRPRKVSKGSAATNGSNGHVPAVPAAAAAAPVLRKDGDVSGVVRRIKTFAGEFGGLKGLKNLVDVLVD